MSEKTVLLIGFWLLFLGGALGIIVGAAWFFMGARTMTDWAIAGLGGAATMTASALVAFLRSKI